jgi:hypothetical protein
MALSYSGAYLAELRNSYTWPDYWRKAILKIETVPHAGDFRAMYYVLPVGGDEFVRFDSPEEIDRWAYAIHRMERTSKP